MQGLTVHLLYTEDFDDMKRVKNILKISIFMFFTVLSLHGMNRLLIHKSPEVMMMDEFISLDKNTVDLLCVGSSHAYTSCNTEVYWNEFGIPAYCISGPAQPVASSYYYILEAIKYQKPKVILFEVSCITTPYSGYEYGNVNNLVWMPYSLNRWKAWKDTVAEPYQENLTWNLFYFHNRWKELGKADFDYVAENRRPNTKGFNPWWNYTDYADNITVWGTDYQIEPSAESIESVDKIISLCQKEDIKLIAYLSAHNIDENSYGQINWYKDFFRDKNVEFIDGIEFSEQLGIEPEIDNSNGHIAYSGAVKLSRYIGEYLSDNGYVVDRRGDIRYEEWEKWSHYYENTKDIYSLVNIKDMEAYLQKVSTLKNATVVIIYGGSNEGDVVDETLQKVVSDNNIYINCNSSNPSACILYDSEMIWQGEGQMKYEQKKDDHDICVFMNEEKEFSVIIDYSRITEMKQHCDEQTLYIYVYNNFAEEVAENRVFDLKSEVE